MTARDVMLETAAYGFERCKAEMIEMGSKVRAALEERGFKSVAAPGFQAPGVVVSYTEDDAIGAKFKAAGLQIAAGVPFQVSKIVRFLDSFAVRLANLKSIYSSWVKMKRYRRAHSPDRELLRG